MTTPTLDRDLEADVARVLAGDRPSRFSYALLRAVGDRIANRRSIAAPYPIEAAALLLRRHVTLENAREVARRDAVAYGTRYHAEVLAARFETIV